MQVRTGKNEFKEIDKNKTTNTSVYGSNFNVTNNLFITMNIMMSIKQTNKQNYKHVYPVYKNFIQLCLSIHCNNLTSCCVIMNKAFIIMIYNIHVYLLKWRVMSTRLIHGQTEHNIYLTISQFFATKFTEQVYTYLYIRENTNRIKIKCNLNFLIGTHECTYKPS